MTQQRHLYWDSGSKDLRMFADGGAGSGLGDGIAGSLEVLSYFLRKRYAYLLDTGGTDIPGTLGDTGREQPDDQWQVIGGAYNTHRQIGSHTEPNDNIPIDDPTREPYIEPDTAFTSDMTSMGQDTVLFFQNQIPDPAITVPTEATINNTGLLYWSSPDLAIGPISEDDLRHTLVDHCLYEMMWGDEVGSYRVALSDPGGGTWSDKGQFMDDTTYYTYGNETTVGDYRLYLKTANTTEPSSPDNYIRWDDTNNEIQLESSTDYSATATLINDVYLNIIKRRHPMYTVHSTQTGINRGTIYDKIIGGVGTGDYSVVLTGPAGTGSQPYHDGVYTRTYEPTGIIKDNTGPVYFNLTGTRSP